MQHDVIEVSLANGIKGLFVHAPNVPVMSFDFNFRAGDYYVDDVNKWEAAHVMEHMVPQANKKYRTGRERNIEAEKNGAYSNAYTDAYEIGYDAQCADFEWERILDLELASITGPLFLEEEFQAEMGNVREELVMRGNNHFSTLILNYWQSIGMHTMPWQERSKRVDNVTLADVVAHYKKTHTTPNMRFVIGGDLPLERRKIIEEKLLKIDLPTVGSRTELPDLSPISKSAKPLFVEQDNAPDNVIMFFETFAGRRISDPESDALGMVNAILTRGLSSRIFAEARERGLLYNIDYSGHSTYKNVTGYGIGIQVQAKNIDEVVDLIVREYQRILDGVIDMSDIELARSSALGSFQMSNQTISRTASWYCDRYFFDDTVEDFFRVPDDINAVTRESGIEVFKSCFADNNWGVSFFGPIDEPSRTRINQKFATLFT
jgi:predicted Zn-dependent peptidase